MACDVTVKSPISACQKVLLCYVFNDVKVIHCETLCIRNVSIIIVLSSHSVPIFMNEGALVSSG